MNRVPTRWCLKLEKIQVDPANENFTSVEGVLYDKQVTTLINIPAGIKAQKFKVPNTVTKIIGRSMEGCNKLKTIEIPINAEIDPDAFIDTKNIRVIRY